MWVHYTKMAWRNLTRDRAYTALNVFVLVIGAASFLLISLFVKDEMSYDRHHDKADRIYRIWTDLGAEGPGERSASMSFPVADALEEDFPELVERSVRFFNMQAPFITLGVDSVRFNEPDVYFADEDVFQVFSIPLLEGNPDSALAVSDGIVISEDLALKYFGRTDVVGEPLLAESNIPLVVTGVLARPENSSHLPMNALISMKAVHYLLSENFTSQNWVWNPCWTYVLLREDVSPEELEIRLYEFVDAHYPDFMRHRMAAHLMPLRDIHLRSHLQYEAQTNGHVENVQLFSIIGFFILIVACINYTNLATSRSTRNAKEVGVSKVLGATKKELIFRFLAESVITSGISVFVSLVAVELSLPWFNALTGKHLSSGSLFEPWTLVAIVGLTIGLGLLAGLYPAWTMSSTSPMAVLRRSKGKNKGIRVRRGLVLVQFCVALGMIIGTVVVVKQFNYLQSQDIGFDDRGLMVVPVKWDAAQTYRQMRLDLLEEEAIDNVTRMNDVVGVTHNMHEYNYDGLAFNDYVYFASLIVDEHFISTVGLELIAGRDFGQPGDDSTGLVVNETLVRHMGWADPEDALGQRFNTADGDERIIGVVRDFHFVSLAEQIQPFALDIVKGPAEVFFTRYITLRVKRGMELEAHRALEKAWAEYHPGQPLDAFFLSDALEEAYRSQNTLRDLMVIFSAVSISIAALGLLGLSAFTAEQKTRELSIRRIVGASHRQLFQLLAADFLRMALVGIIITAPLTYFILRNWLNGFAYHIQMDWGNLFIAAGAGVLLTLLAIVFQAWRAMRLDALAALRYE